MSDKVSIIIPSRNERFLNQTVADIFEKAHSDVEVIVVLDGGPWPSPLPQDSKKRLILHHHSRSHGMRAAICEAAASATGKYLLKCDGHVMFAPGFDVTLKADCDKDWVVIPRRFALDADNWKIREDRSPIDYHYLSHPFEKPDHIGLHGKPWKERAKERASAMIDDEMSSQGSCWFQHKAYFDKFGLPEEGYGSFTQEFQQIAMRTWLSGGRVVINKNTFYAHLWKKDRGYSLPNGEQTAGALYSADYWLNNRMPKPLRVHTFKWFLEKFWPVPTWPEDLGAGLQKARTRLAAAAGESA